MARILLVSTRIEKRACGDSANKGRTEKKIWSVYVLTLKYILALWLLVTINTDPNCKQIRNKGLNSHDS